MKTSIIALSLAAIITSGAPPFAQNANANAQCAGKAETTGSVSVDAKTNFGTVISGPQAGKSADLTTFNKDTRNISCVNVSSLSGGGDAAVLNNALAKQAPDVEPVRPKVKPEAGGRRSGDRRGETLNETGGISECVPNVPRTFFGMNLR